MHLMRKIIINFHLMEDKPEPKLCLKLHVEKKPEPGPNSDILSGLVGLQTFFIRKNEIRTALP